MTDVFLSYARSERGRVLPLKTALERLGLTVFFDTQNIDGGDSFPDVIDRAVKGARAVVSAWSPHSLTRDWVKNECRVGQKRGVLIPVAIAPISYEEIPVDFSSLHYLNLIDFKSADADLQHEGYLTLISQLERILKRRLTSNVRDEARSVSAADVRSGQDTSYRLDLTFHEAALGTTKRLRFGDRVASVLIEAGSRHGESLRLKGRGGTDGHGPGDAILRLHVGESDIFNRQGNDLIVELPISILEALDGAKIKVPTLKDFVEAVVPAGSNSGDFIKVAGYGIDGGDLLCRLRITLPDRDNHDLRRFLIGWPSAQEKPLRPTPSS
jgi:hypothetical protein